MDFSLEFTLYDLCNLFIDLGAIEMALDDGFLPFYPLYSIGWTMVIMLLMIVFHEIVVDLPLPNHPAHQTSFIGFQDLFFVCLKYPSQCEIPCERKRNLY